MPSIVKYPAHSKLSTNLLRILGASIVKGVVLSYASESPGAFEFSVKSELLSMKSELFSMKSGLNIFRKVYF